MNKKLNEDGTLKNFYCHYGLIAAIQWLLYYWKRNFRIFKVDKMKIYYKKGEGEK